MWFVSFTFCPAKCVLFLKEFFTMILSVKAHHTVGVFQRLEQFFYEGCVSVFGSVRYNINGVCTGDSRMYLLIRVRPCVSHDSVVITHDLCVTHGTPMFHP